MKNQNKAPLLKVGLSSSKSQKKIGTIALELLKFVEKEETAHEAPHTERAIIKREFGRHR